MNEFEIINTFFNQPQNNSKNSNNLHNLKLSIGDDCAMFGEYLICKDLLLEHIHFFSDIDPYALGHKSLAVNLSDLAAMGSIPCFFLLGIALPNKDEAWLAQFSSGLLSLAQKHNCILIGGDTTKSTKDICISITAIGKINSKSNSKILQRNNAQINDDIWVSGLIGEARLALGHKYKEWSISAEAFEHCIQRMQMPSPRVELGLLISNMANACIDISDGLLGDLGHILKASNVSAEINIDNIALSPYLHKTQCSKDIMLNCILCGGDDYELCFTAPTTHRNAIMEVGEQLNLPLSRIGKVSSQLHNMPNISAQYEGEILSLDNTFTSFMHF
jgi:thiamine-monophosphate kinase